MTIVEDYGRAYPIRFVVMARLSEDKDETGNEQYIFYLSCNHFVKLPENLALKPGTRNIKSVVRCYKCEPESDD